MAYLALLDLVPSLNIMLNNIKDNWATQSHMDLDVMLVLCK